MKIFLKPTISNFFFISFIAFHLSPCFSEDALDAFKACGVSYNCGELVNIAYPFWGSENQGSCGRQEFKLNCKNNRTTTIYISSLEYNVLKINQSNNRMRIARSDLFDDYCPRSQIQVASMFRHPFVYSSKNQNISVWYNCSADNKIRIPERYSFSCGWEAEKHGRVNYAFEPSAASWSLAMEDCKMKIEVTVTTEWLKEGIKNRTSLVEKAVKQGFEVEYENWYKGACEECNASGGKCAGNDTYPFYCICENGGVANPYVCESAPGPPLSRITVGIGCIIFIISIIIFIYYIRRRILDKDKIEEIIKKYSTQIPRRYSYSKLKKMTDSFKNKLGQGGFSTVYKGSLPDGREVAVKLLNEFQENGHDFMNEVVSISSTSHVNIISLLGFCYEQNKRALIYEYMPKGSLEKYISHKLDWNTLYSIVVGIAQGLEYLHRGCNTRILHFDIKPHNILLDNEFCPKISDFGLAKQCRARESHVSMTGVKGTVGFIAPEVVFRNFGKVSHKSDVYSYGMLVLEMVGERKNPNELGVGDSSEKCFPDWIYENLAGSEIDGGCRWGDTEEEEEMVRKMIIVGLCCIQTSPEERPSMSDVVAMLEGSMDGLQIPPKSTLFGPPELPQPSSSSTTYLYSSRSCTTSDQFCLMEESQL